MEGQLVCASCVRQFPILRGIPRFAIADELETDKAATAANFGWQWQHFTHSDEHYADQFLAWVAPARPEFFQGRVVFKV